MNYALGYCVSCGVKINSGSCRKKYCSSKCYQSRCLSLGQVIDAIYSARGDFQCDNPGRIPRNLYLGRTVARALLKEVRANGLFLVVDHLWHKGTTVIGMSLKAAPGIRADEILVTDRDIEGSRPWVRLSTETRPGLPKEGCFYA